MCWTMNELAAINEGAGKNMDAIDLWACRILASESIHPSTYGAALELGPRRPGM